LSHSQFVRTLELVNLACLAGSALMAGLFFAFSISVMKALRTLPPPCGIAAMQSINVVIINPLFLTIFLGTAPACVLATILSLVWASPGTLATIAGSAFYLIGVLFVTMRLNVPLNNALARVSPETSEAIAVWNSYLARWTTWNHVRALAGLGATLSFALAR
jgi:uncharacterized membrane protein